MQITVIVGHPRAGSYCEALGEAYAKGARAAGHEVTLIKLAELDFDPILRSGFDPQPLEPDLVNAQDAIGQARHIVWIWPLWLGFPPAILKGFAERVLTEGFAFERLAGPPYYRPLLKGRSARVIVTMQMPAWMFILMAGARAARTFSKQILNFIGIKPVRRTYLGMVDFVDDARRRKWLTEVEEMGRAAR